MQEVELSEEELSQLRSQLPELPPSFVQQCNCAGTPHPIEYVSDTTLTLCGALAHIGWHGSSACAVVDAAALSFYCCISTHSAGA